jgi:hypothetical protein
VAEQDLDDADVGASLQQVGSVRSFVYRPLVACWLAASAR